MPLDKDIQSMFAALRLRFQELMEKTILELECLSNTLPGHSDPAVVLETIRVLAHRLAGTAPSFGYVSVGDQAAQLEDAISHWTSCQSVNTEDHISALLESFLEEMERSLYGD